MTWISTLSSIGMATGPPLVYLDQYRTIQKNKNSIGFSHQTCLVLLVSNITRLFYWLGERFDTALLIQSILMVFTQLGLLRLCLRYSSNRLDQNRDSISTASFSSDNPHSPSHMHDQSPRSSTLLITPLQSNPGSLIQSSSSSSSSIKSSSASSSYRFFGYLDQLAALIASEAVLFLVLQRFDWFVQLIGFIALGLESTLPIPQLISNYQRKSLAGFSSFVLFGWLFGDCFKSVYLIFITPDQNPIQFKICGLFQLTIDFLILFQSIIYRKKTKIDNINLVETNSSSSESIIHSP
ncbi:hypothetical protein BY996DRAFT_4573158 [Phakopsora pachyrhizi]|uniref:PQ loop repeat protein n=1 Tax=Phakopsora pachyrhizi TaxID=170000 RepID=A0AAV0BSH5_PHAPC|nr:hypothetical protein BY996DRAFT_4573158 [Phakopsora pachyrhizi]CAH7689377.1 hypothetical protein PPACK8108_LOCUS24438 [Phakopsora pachyrhizi]